MKNYFIFILFLLFGTSCLVVDRDEIYLNEKSYILNELAVNRYTTHKLQEITVDSSKYHFLSNIFGGIAVGQSSIGKELWLQERNLTIIKNCIHNSLSNESQFFDSFAWGELPLNSNNPHLAYLGYLNMLLSMNRYLELHPTENKNYPRNLYVDSSYVRLNNNITTKLLNSFYNSTSGVLETYPSQAITVDNVVALASIALYYKAYNKEYSDTFNNVFSRFLDISIDKNTGLLNYYIDYKTGESDNTIRGSGSAVAMYFMSFIDLRESEKLYTAIKTSLKDTVYGIYGIREYLRDGEKDPRIAGDTDTGPIVYGLGTTSTGFTIAGAKLFKDEITFNQLTKTAWLVGIPINNIDGVTFINAGVLENFTMFMILSSIKIE